MKNPYGIDEQGRYTTVQDLSPSTQYGLACNLTCPECGRPLVAVRAAGRQMMSHLAHHAEDTDCTGYGESASHALAKEILSQAAEEHATFTLPPVFISDAMPHAKLPAKMYAHANPKMKAIDVRIENVWFEYDAKERFIQGSKIPDAVMEFSYRGRTSQVAIEICNTHAKTVEDVREYAKEDKIRGVIEIDVSSLIPTPENAIIFRELLKHHILSHPKKSADRYWLYNPKMKEMLDSYELCIYVDVPEGMYADPYSVASVFNKHMADWCAEHGRPERFHIISSCPNLAKSMDNIVHDTFDGNAYQSMPGYMTGITRSVWADAAEARRLSIAEAVNPVPYGRFAEEPEFNAFQYECVETFKKLVEEISKNTKDVVTRQYEDAETCWVVNDVRKTRTGRSVMDRLMKSQCPRKRLCTMKEGTEAASDGRALCQCVDECQFCKSKRVEKMGNGYEVRLSECFFFGARDENERLRAGFHKDVDTAVDVMRRARYAELNEEEEKKRRGTRRRRKR